MNITLKYRRVEHHYTGHFLYSVGDAVVQEEFTLEYREMLKRLCNILNQYCPKEALVVVTLQRTDRDGLLPVDLDATTVHLLRTDPVAGIAALTYEKPSAPLTAVARKKIEGAVYQPEPVRAGIDALAQAFGDEVYVRVRDGKVECPCCGFWIRDILQVPAGGMGDMDVSCTKSCHNRFRLRIFSDWASVPVAELLNATSADRFYLTREWANGQSWVSREMLRKRYNAYLREKAQAHG